MQADSFVVNSDLWKDEFLKFDYIGGPWPNKIEINPNLILHLEKNLLLVKPCFHFLGQELD